MPKCLQVQVIAPHVDFNLDRAAAIMVIALYGICLLALQQITPPKEPYKERLAAFPAYKVSVGKIRFVHRKLIINPQRFGALHFIFILN